MNFNLLLVGLGIAFLTSCKQEAETVEVQGIDQADALIKSIVVPQFPDKNFSVDDYGAKGDTITLNTDAFKEAIKACNVAGGGRVLVPKGVYLTGPVHLLSNVNLHLEEGAEIRFTKDKQAYLPLVHTSYEGVELMNYSPLIYAYKQKNIAITGKGTLNGQGGTDNWWPWCGKDTYGYQEGMPKQGDSLNLPRLRRLNEQQAPVSERIFGEGYYLRPTFVEPFECENILIQGITITNAPFWVIHPLKSANITVDGVTVKSHGPNNDGCDPEYSSNVHIKNCLFDTGDDCIAIKSGRNNDGRRVNMPSENIVVENCEMKDGHGGVVMGSEISAGVRNVFVRDCKMDSPNLDRAIRIKTNTLRGGFVENVFVDNIYVGEVKEAVLRINTYYDIHGNQEGDFLPTIRNIHLSNVKVVKGGKYGILIKGREELPVKDVYFTNVTIDGVQTPLSVENSEPVNFTNTTINGKAY
nr:glycoside hydrolase family 28 protein [Robertkochia solimangrovi]